MTIRPSTDRANSYRADLAALLNIHSMTCASLEDGELRAECDCEVGKRLIEIHDRLEDALGKCDGPSGELTPKEAERLQRLRDYGYVLQNRLDTKPVRYEMGHTEARLSAIKWAVEKICGIPFDLAGQPDATRENK